MALVGKILLKVVKKAPQKTTAAKVVSKNVKVVAPTSRTSSVKKVVRKTAPKTGLETRGAKPTKLERINRARDVQWEKAERAYDAGSEMAYTGLVSSNKGRVAARGAGKKNQRKRDAIRREASKSLPIQINSARPFKSIGADELKANNARGLKAANKPVSKGNRNIGGPVVRNIIKNSPPARANRTRLGNPAKKK